MQIFSGVMTVEYSGRGETVLPEYKRVLIIKKDGSVSIHSDAGFEPFGMNAPTMIQKQDKTWTIKNGKEVLKIFWKDLPEAFEIVLDGKDPGHVFRGGTEKELQEWFSRNLGVVSEVVGKELELIGLEMDTGAGAVDILARSNDGLVAIEVKRHADMNAIGQINRYVESLKDSNSGKVIGVIAAQSFKPTMFKMAFKHQIFLVEAPENWGHGDFIPPPKTLFD